MPGPCSLRMGEGLVELEEFGDEVGFGDGGGGFVGSEDGAVVGAVRREEVGGDVQGGVKIREGGVGVRGVGVEDCAGDGFGFFTQRRGGAEGFYGTKGQKEGTPKR